MARRRDRWRVRVLGLEIMAALLCDTLSLIMPIRFARRPMFRKIHLRTLQPRGKFYFIYLKDLRDN